MTKTLSNNFANVYGSILNLYNVNHKTPRVLISKELQFPWSGATYVDRLWGNMNQLQIGVLKVLDAIDKDMTPDELLAKLDRVTEKSINKLALLQRVEQEHFINMGTLQAFKKMGIKEVVWYTRNDERVCEVCGRLHKKVFDIDRVPTIPAHPRCRCRLVMNK